MNETGVLMEYGQILLGNTINSRSKFTATYISKNADDRYALHLLRYVFEEILDWSPIVTRTFLSGELIDMLKLRVVANSIQFPPELSPKTDYFYYAWRMYPEMVHITQRELTLNVYEKVLQGMLIKYPKGFFLKLHGEINKAICLNYAIEQYLHPGSIEEIYKFFSDKKKALQFLEKYRLVDIYREQYSDPLDMLHDCLNSFQKNALLYQFYKFNKSLKEEIRLGNKYKQ